MGCNARLKHLAGHSPVLVLGFCGGLGLNASRRVPHDDRRFGFVAVLTAWSGIARREDLDLGIGDGVFGCGPENLEYRDGDG